MTPNIGPFAEEFATAGQLRVAMITGCDKSIGIGISTARALSEVGMFVVATDVEPAGRSNEHNVQGDMGPSWGGVDGGW